MSSDKKIAILITLVFLYGCSSSQLEREAGKHNNSQVPQQEVKGKEVNHDGRNTRRDKVETFARVSSQIDLAKTSVTKKRVTPMAEMERRPATVPSKLYSVADVAQPPVLSYSQESYTPYAENGFISTVNDPLSTFSIDVDTASYSNIRRFIMRGSLPPVGAVRVEEMINYFSYSYPSPVKAPLSVSSEVGPSPWQPENKLVRIGLKAKDISKKDLPSSNLVFLIDVSGSMNSPNKLPLLKKSMKMLVSQLGKKDRIAIVVYAGSDRIVLQPTSGAQKAEINRAIDALASGGSTHGSRGIVSAYKLAEQTLMPEGNNRIILASDGDFNVGVTSRGELTRLIEEKRESGIYLSVLGFGMGNYHDDTMEILADKGNGNYAYIDSLLEAKKVMVKEMSGTLFTLASDVKIQVEFNPAKVGAYRLVGYENRALADEDFNNDKKDAGEIGVGDTVTALYELVMAGNATIPDVDPLKYQRPQVGKWGNSDELLTVKVRYKPQQKQQSLRFEHVVKDGDLRMEKTSTDFRFTAAVAAYGMLLKHSQTVISYKKLLDLAKGAKGVDAEGYRAEFIRLVEMSEMLDEGNLAKSSN